MNDAARESRSSFVAQIELFFSSAACINAAFFDHTTVSKRAAQRVKPAVNLALARATYKVATKPAQQSCGEALCASRRQLPHVMRVTFLLH